MTKWLISIIISERLEDVKLNRMKCEKKILLKTIEITRYILIYIIIQLIIQNFSK